MVIQLRAICLDETHLAKLWLGLIRRKNQVRISLSLASLSLRIIHPWTCKIICKSPKSVTIFHLKFWNNSSSLIIHKFKQLKNNIDTISPISETILGTTGGEAEGSGRGERGRRRIWNYLFSLIWFHIRDEGWGKIVFLTVEPTPTMDCLQCSCQTTSAISAPLCNRIRLLWRWMAKWMTF